MRSSVPPWLLGALEDIGVTETPGPQHTARVIQYHSNTGKWSRDEVPWCGSAIETWLSEAGYHGLGRPGALARNWARWGRPAAKDEQLGAVCVIKRRKTGADASTGSRGGYHVGVFLNRSRGGVAMVSGNASDRVGVDVYSRRRYELVALRLPIE